MPIIATESFQGSIVVECIVVADHPMISIEERYSSPAGRILRGPRILVAPCRASALIASVMEVQDVMEAGRTGGGPRVGRTASPAARAPRAPRPRPLETDIPTVPRSAFYG